MLLKQIRDYLQLVGRASLQDLSRHFKLQESAMQQMLDFWVKKGQVKLISPEDNNCSSGKCSDCFECSEGAKLIYVWLA